MFYVMVGLCKEKSMIFFKNRLSRIHSKDFKLNNNKKLNLLLDESEEEYYKWINTFFTLTAY